MQTHVRQSSGQAGKGTGYGAPTVATVALLHGIGVAVGVGILLAIGVVLAVATLVSTVLENRRVSRLFDDAQVVNNKGWGSGEGQDNDVLGVDIHSW